MFLFRFVLFQFTAWNVPDENLLLNYSSSAYRVVQKTKTKMDTFESVFAYSREINIFVLFLNNW